MDDGYISITRQITNTVLKRCHPRPGREAAVGDPGKTYMILDPRPSVEDDNVLDPRPSVEDDKTSI